MFMKKICTLLASLYSLSLCAQNFESKSLYYDASGYKLTAAQKKTLDSVIVYYSNRRISINGHADYLGSEDRTSLLAENRAKAVLRYLVDRGFPETQIMNSSGWGQNANSADASNAGVAHPLSRRVDILITKGPSVVAALKEVVVPPPPPPPQKVVAEVKPSANVTNIDYDVLKVGDLIALKNISFIPSSDRLMPEAYLEVQNLFEVLNAHPTLKISLEGHVCCVPAPDGLSPGTVSWDLSENRARRVQGLLIELGIQGSRLSYRGFGRTRPLYPGEKTGEEQQANRRVEIRIISK